MLRADCSLSRKGEHKFVRINMRSNIIVHSMLVQQVAVTVTYASPRLSAVKVQSRDIVSRCRCERRFCREAKGGCDVADSRG